MAANININFLTQEELCVSIISLKNHLSESQSQSLPKVLNDILSTIIFPVFSQNEVKQVLKEIQSHANSSLNQLDQFDIFETQLFSQKFSLFYRNDFMEYISLNFDKVTSAYPFISQCILLMYISWTKRFKESRDISNLSFLLENLLHISRPINFPIFQRIQQLALSAFFHAYLNYLSFSPLIDFPKIFDNLKIFFGLDVHYPTSSYNLLNKTFDRVLSHKSSVDENDINFLFESTCLICRNASPSFLKGETNSLSNHIIFPEQVASSILLMILPRISKLQESALLLYKKLIKFQININGDDFQRYSALFVDSLENEILNNSEKPFLRLSKPTKTDFVTLPQLTAPEVTLRFWEKTVFEGGINMKTNIMFPDKINYKKLIPEKFRKQLKIIISSLSTCNYISTQNNTNVNQNNEANSKFNEKKEKAIDFFVDQFSELVRKYKVKLESNQIDFASYADFCLVYLYIMLHVDSFVRKNDFREILLDLPMFDPSITVFDKYNEYDIIDGLRTAVIDLALKNTRTLFEILYLKHVSHPYLFAEITHRIIRNPNLVVDSINIPIFSRALMCASMYYQPLHYPDEQNTSVQITLSIEAARTSIFLFISQLMSISPESPSLFYSNQIFVSFFLSFLFETPLRSFILSNLLNFLSRQEIISEPLIDMLVQIIQICSPLFPEEKFVVLVFDIIQTLTDVLIHQRSITKYFEPLCAPIFLSLNSLIQSELAHNYILQCVQFFALTAFTQTVNFPQIAALEKAIQTVYGTNIPQQLINRLIQMMAGEILATLTPSFIIHQPKVLKLFVKISLDDSHFLESINFVDQLCQFSALNCQRCRWCDFDLFLIDLIKEREEPKIVSALLNLFQHIASSISSVSVVQRYISLLSPKDGRKIHVNMPYYLSTMNNIISTAARLPVVSIPLTKNSAVVDIQGVTAADLENGFTFVFWIYVDTTNAQYKPSIFHLSDSKGNKIFCFLSSAFLFFNQRSATFESNGKIDVQLPIQQWSFVSVTYKRIDEEDTEIRTTFGCKKMKVLEFLTMPLQPGQISCQIGGVTPDSLQSDTFTRLGSFGLFRELTIEEITAISELGPRPTGNLITQPLFFYNIDEFKGSLILQTKASSPGVESRISKSSISFNNTFSDILINYCKVEILLPLFSLLDLKMNDGNIFKNAVKYAVEIIGNTLMISNRAQEGFLRANGFAIISHLLLSASPKHIDYNLYYQFFTLMQSFTNTKLQESIAKNILLNEDIWIHSDSDSHLRILKHWSRVLIPSLKSFSSTYPRNSEKSETDLNENDDSLRISFQDILYIMRVYYWYEPVTEEKDYIKLNRSYDLNVYECRQQMNHIALMLANERFTSNDYLCLASHIFTCAENKQVIDLLVLLKELALSSNHVLFWNFFIC
ncbi:hypothetical protein TRFO_22493 [Tritrichomonas foetus]|uniref:DUF4704 domain-containing protein n=1 Tax=Tritrichomonas foetus TaxID=1144522 RepID=A0A1J4KGQ5_9EUKA|nr:hypothetical protein TRFO_22493 [Tritrichomonas foetus]|eukprot:OHT08838.1 hypothetical protein TRFO_22493 [Tritrichomonas foetus]